MSGYKSISGENLSHIPTFAAMAEAELNHCDPSIMARMEIGLKACDGIESLLNLLVESGMISTCKLAISEVIRCETCGHLDNPCSHMSDISDFCSEWQPIEERGGMQFKRRVDLWLFENDVGKGDYVGRWAIHAYARAGYGSNPDSYDILAITDEKETAEFALEITGCGDFVNRCVFLLGSIGALLSSADVDRIGKFWNEIQEKLND